MKTTTYLASRENAAMADSSVETAAMPHKFARALTLWNGGVTLDDDMNGLLASAPIWSQRTFEGTNPALMVFCDSPYDPSSYLYEKA